MAECMPAAKPLSITPSLAIPQVHIMDVDPSWDQLYADYLRSEQELEAVLGHELTGGPDNSVMPVNRPNTGARTSYSRLSTAHPHADNEQHAAATMPQPKQLRQGSHATATTSAPRRQLETDPPLGYSSTPLFGRGLQEMVLARSSYAMQRPASPPRAGHTSQHLDGAADADEFFSLMHRGVSPGRIALFPHSSHSSVAAGPRGSSRDASPGRPAATATRASLDTEQWRGQWTKPERQPRQLSSGGHRGVWRPGGSGISTTAASRSGSPPPPGYLRSGSPPPGAYEPPLPLPRSSGRTLGASTSGDGAAASRRYERGTQESVPSSSEAMQRRPPVAVQQKAAWAGPFSGMRDSGSSGGRAASRPVAAGQRAAIGPARVQQGYADDGMPMLLGAQTLHDGERDLERLFFSPQAYKAFSSQPGEGPLPPPAAGELSQAAKQHPTAAALPPLPPVSSLAHASRYQKMLYAMEGAAGAHTMAAPARGAEAPAQQQQPSPPSEHEEHSSDATSWVPNEPIHIPIAVPPLLPTWMGRDGDRGGAGEVSPPIGLTQFPAWGADSEHLPHTSGSIPSSSTAEMEPTMALPAAAGLDLPQLTQRLQESLLLGAGPAPSAPDGALKEALTSYADGYIDGRCSTEAALGTVRAAALAFDACASLIMPPATRLLG